MKKEQIEEYITLSEDELKKLVEMKISYISISEPRHKPKKKKNKDYREENCTKN
jgi:hypothetical protein